MADKKKITGKLFPLMAMLLGSLIFSAGLIEVGMRLVDYNFPLVSQHDPFAGYSDRANLSGWVENESLEHIKTDQFGFRVDSTDAGQQPHSLEKPDDEFRIAVIGDSFTQSFHVSYAESFPATLQGHLQACAPAGRRVNVLNFAVSGYSNVQELMSFRHRARLFSPDLVLMMFHAENDLRNNFRKLENYPYAPYAEFRNGKLVIDESFRVAPGFLNKLTWANVRNDLANHSRLAQFAIGKVGRWLQLRWHNRRVSGWEQAKDSQKEIPAAENPSAAKTDVEPKKAVKEPGIFRGDFSPFFAEDFTPPGLPRVSPEFSAPESLFFEMLWQLAEGVLLEVRDDVRQSGAQFWLSSTATAIAIDADPNNRVRKAADLGIGDGFDYATRRLTAFAEKNGIGYVPLTYSMRNFAVSNKVDFHHHPRRDFHGGHWNAKGHAVVAKTLAQRLCPSVSK